MRCLAGVFEAVHRLQMSLETTEIKFGFLRSEDGSSQISHSDLLARQGFPRRHFTPRRGLALYLRRAPFRAIV